MNSDTRSYARLTYALSKGLNRRFPQLGEEMSAQVSAFVTYLMITGCTHVELETGIRDGVKELNHLYNMALPDDIVGWLSANAMLLNRIISSDLEEDDEY